MRWCSNCERHAAKGYRVGHCEGATCNRCPWPGCPCTHDNGCDRGFIECKPDDEASMAQLRHCTTCVEWAQALKLAPSEVLWRSV